MFIEVKFLLTFVLIGSLAINLCILETVILIEYTKFDSCGYLWNHSFTCISVVNYPRTDHTCRFHVYWTNNLHILFLWVCVCVLNLKFVFLAERSNLIWVQYGWNTNKTTQWVWDVQWVRGGGASLQCLGVRLVLPNDQGGLCQHRAVQVGGQAPMGRG